MKLTRLAFTAFLLATFAPAARADGESTSTLPRPDPAIAEFARGVKFTVAGYTGSEPLVNFPVLVRITERPDGHDLLGVGNLAVGFCHWRQGRAITEDCI